MPTTLTTLDVTGMTCGHCVSAVTNELETVDGVQSVTVELHAGGTSEVTVLSHAPLAEDALRAAIDEAGYDVTGVRAHGEAEEWAEEGHAQQTADDAAAGSAGVPASGGGCGCGCGTASDAGPNVVEIGKRPS
ncbi:Heavy metal transport/detoxification protein [Beutenbergia cavernae DSM 12333]|uniref:Heavy metal transport/detoxification protein n=1 Tax=Beutenbergia cavernae (strain ATCC BAA-8 / DSM 12333 / CCUG 43141 / JCM 11478 / NBRC 16432 / NCIMB 13614 / HKI 0122) TaxID=471853 RepID=C5C5C3_BEUC1|nr:cation transporter [Beutenbergia cavernae]ACQ82263.1 Heavy metal transport/detoxification protein [Beutenbergia cavernae DSM 12333]